MSESKEIVERKNYTEWYNGLNNTERDIVNGKLNNIRQFGHYGRYGKDYKKLQGQGKLWDGLWELKFNCGYRIYYINDGNSVVVLMTGGNKASQKKDISKARNLIQEYLAEKRS